MGFFYEVSKVAFCGTLNASAMVGILWYFNYTYNPECPDSEDLFSDACNLSNIIYLSLIAGVGYTSSLLGLLDNPRPRIG